IQTGTHPNYLQFGSGNATSVDVEFNTSYQTTALSGGEGYQFYDNGSGGTISNATLAYNTMIATGSLTNMAMSYLIHGSALNGGRRCRAHLHRRSGRPWHGGRRGHRRLELHLNRIG